MAWGRGGEGDGEEPSYYDVENAWSSVNHLILSGYVVSAKQDKKGQKLKTADFTDR